MLFMIGQSRFLCKTKIQVPVLILLFTTFQAKGFPPTSAKCTENHWLVKDVSDSLPEKRSKKKQPFHTLPQYLYSINKYEIEN